MLRIAVVLVAMALAAPAWAQSATCADEVKKERDRPELRVQGGKKGEVGQRYNAAMYLDEAAKAAAQGDEQTCRTLLAKAQNLLPR
jgi:hypothetical protein